MGNYEFDTRGHAWWDEEGTETVTFDGNTYKINYIILRPDAVQEVKVDVINDHTIELTYDKDER